ncbi:hypothetical protein L1987_50736 [Smallanthus sonchifolius]|uniref:Uncharacterized protein n=1 Tax=Smallanthus sonchifolius TaxID=185202 RepID=A0ACB9EN99_9ASTR|nr:hypothetical protein L1987_50736 [Smallanthus sonchifolius]
MKNSQLLVIFGLFFFGLLHIPTSNASFSTTNPTYNVNLAPFIQRRSAYYCLQNFSSDCPGSFTLTEGGWLNISESATDEFCKGGCVQHTQDVLRCVWYVHQEYTFENGAMLKDINETMRIGCEKGFNGTSLYKSSGTSRATTSASAALYALVFLALFYM